MKTLVTGATGLLGNNLVRAMLDRGQHVRAMALAARNHPALEGLNVEAISGDVRDVSAVEAAMNGVDAVIHCAAFIHFGWSKLDISREINVHGTRHVAEVARRRGARMIHVSSCDTLAPGQKDCPADEETPGHKVACAYVVSKREAEQVVQEQIAEGLHATIVNPGFILGPWDWTPSSGRMIVDTTRRFTPLAPRGGASVCDARDVATGILAAVKRGRIGRRYILSGENITYYDLWWAFARCAGTRGPWCTGPPTIRFLLGLLGDLKYKLSGAEPEINSASLRMASHYHFYTCKRAKSELDYDTRPMEETIEDAWKWFVDHGYT